MALGIAADGQKHALGLWDGSTENAAVCQSLLANLQSRGLRTDRSLLVILDGSKALHKAVRAIFGDAALDSALPSAQAAEHPRASAGARSGPWVAGDRRAAPIRPTEVKTAHRLLQISRAAWRTEYPSAAESVREGLDETLTILTLEALAAPAPSLATTNAVGESRSAARGT